MKSRMNEAFFSFFACSQRPAAPDPLKLTCHSPATPLGRQREGGSGKITKSVLAASRSASARQSALQYSFDERSFNINCGFSADGNVFFIAGVTLWWSGRPAVCDARSCVADELLFYTLHVWMRLFRFKCLFSFELFCPSTLWNCSSL